jgi:hypothetical protein
VSNIFGLLTLNEFIDNPMGRGSTSIPNRKLIVSDYEKRLKALQKRKKIKHTVYRDKDEYYFHVLIPSETERNNTYDVVLHFTMGDEDFKYDNFLKRYYVKFFSNCPSFTYSFAHVFNIYDVLIENLSNKYKDIVFDEMPVIRNPAQVITYEKSTTFAALFIKDSFILKNKMYLNQIAKPYVAVEFNETIRTTDQIEQEIKRENNRLKRESKKKEEESKGKTKKPRGTIIPKVPKERINRKASLNNRDDKTGRIQSSVKKIKPVRSTVKK